MKASVFWCKAASSVLAHACAHGTDRFAARGTSQAALDAQGMCLKTWLGRTIPLGCRACRLPPPRFARLVVRVACCLPRASWEGGRRSATHPHATWTWTRLVICWSYRLRTSHIASITTGPAAAGVRAKAPRSWQSRWLRSTLRVWESRRGAFQGLVHSRDVSSVSGLCLCERNSCWPLTTSALSVSWFP